MIFIDVHDNPYNISNENDITFCLACFNLDNINTLDKISFEIEGETHFISFIFSEESFSRKIPANYFGKNLRNFQKATNFVINRKSGHIEAVVNSYNSIEKIMLLGGKWK